MDTTAMMLIAWADDLRDDIRYPSPWLHILLPLRIVLYAVAHGLTSQLPPVMRRWRKEEGANFVSSCWMAVIELCLTALMILGVIFVVLVIRMLK